MFLWLLEETLNARAVQSNATALRKDLILSNIYDER